MLMVEMFADDISAEPVEPNAPTSPEICTVFEGTTAGRTCDVAHGFEKIA